MHVGGGDARMWVGVCLLDTCDAADDLLGGDLGGCRILKNKTLRENDR
mgnify:CR=1 FL=1